VDRQNITVIRDHRTQAWQTRFVVITGMSNSDQAVLPQGGFSLDFGNGSW
jgi:hypothetical protein